MYIAICLLCLAIVLLALVFPAFFKPSECGQASRPEKGGGSGEAEFPYQAIDKLFSPAERSLLGVLDQVVGSQYRVFGKVRVADLAAVKPGLTKAARQGALNRIASKHFDYVICQATDLVVLCAVELNDRSHATKAAQARDELVVKVCETISLKVLSFPAQQSYSVEDVRAQLRRTIPSLMAQESAEP